MKKTAIYIFFVSIVFILANCQDKKSCSTETIMDPNDSSELTLLMREMHDHYKAVRQQIKEGKNPKEIKSFTAIQTAEPTTEGKTDNDVYRTMAKAYMAAVEELKNSSSQNVHKNFNSLIDNCMGCHQTQCPGPMVRIKKLYLKE